MDLQKGDVLVYVGEPQEHFEAGEEVTVVGKTPKGVMVQFDDEGKLEIRTNDLKSNWELKENDEFSDEEDLPIEEEETKKAKKEKRVKESKTGAHLKKEANSVALERREAFLKILADKGLELIEQTPFTAAKLEGDRRCVFEIYRSSQRFAFNCNELGLSEKSKTLGSVKGYHRTNDFFVTDVPVDANLERLIDESIVYARKRVIQLSEERREAAKEKLAKKKEAKA